MRFITLKYFFLSKTTHLNSNRLIFYKNRRGDLLYKFMANADVPREQRHTLECIRISIFDILFFTIHRFGSILDIFMPHRREGGTPRDA